MNETSALFQNSLQVNVTRYSYLLVTNGTNEWLELNM